MVVADERERTWPCAEAAKFKRPSVLSSISTLYWYLSSNRAETRAWAPAFWRWRGDRESNLNEMTFNMCSILCVECRSPLGILLYTTERCRLKCSAYTTAAFYFHFKTYILHLCRPIHQRLLDLVPQSHDPRLVVGILTNGFRTRPSAHNGYSTRENKLIPFSVVEKLACLTLDLFCFFFFPAPRTRIPNQFGWENAGKECPDGLTIVRVYNLTTLCGVWTAVVEWKRICFWPFTSFTLPSFFFYIDCMSSSLSGYWRYFCMNSDTLQVSMVVAKTGGLGVVISI